MSNVVNPRRVKKLTAVQEALEILREMIASAEIEEAGRLPAEDELAARLGISRLTVREALAVLEREGVIARVQGRGTLVNRFARRLTGRIDSAREIGKFIEENGYRASTDRVKGRWQPAAPPEAAKLEIEPGEEVLVVEKRFLADGKPAAFCVDRVPRRRFSRFDFDIPDLAKAVFPLVERLCNCYLTHDVVEIIPAVAEGRLAEALQVGPGTPILRLDVVVYASEGYPVMYNTEYYLDHFVRFTLCRIAAYMT
ncbi:GntR family transcriptional regulator [Thermanaeromonas sp. C210]|uniref:GntR family transcriptional regulator n=1 Tax=Thermanaeromonas sp. C210 TaxID=2731925 RepID=UPI00155C8DA4|nr:GntR family transcriptional regulator [Thermanaeromonas sp. C210]GFN23709.1 putative HTH-type transcriptional regulator RB1450 [Thermanaeromonas sp. C210]